MLDATHSLALRAVRDGDADPCPAVDDLIATGLVESTPDGMRITAQGTAALRVGAPSRTERMALWVAAAGATVVAIGIVADWLT